MPLILRLGALSLLCSLMVSCATTQEKQVQLSWSPVTTDLNGKAIEHVSYEVYVQVNDGPEKRYGPMEAPHLDIALPVRPCDVVRAQVVSIRDGVRSSRSAPIEQQIPAPADRPGCTPSSAAHSCAPATRGNA